MPPTCRRGAAALRAAPVQRRSAAARGAVRVLAQAAATSTVDLAELNAKFGESVQGPLGGCRPCNTGGAGHACGAAAGRALLPRHGTIVFMR